MLFFLIFIRYSSFGELASADYVEMGRWPIELNAFYNGLAPYFFLGSIVCIFLPIFLGKLSIIRDIFASEFFRPFAKVNFSASCI